MPTVADRDGFMDRVADRAPGHRVGCYATPSYLRNDPIADEYFIWVAHWTSADGPDDCGGDWVLWQYTDKPYDLDRADFPSREAMRKWAGGTGAGPLGLSHIVKAHWQAA
jgi:hypothetical protein